MRLLVLVFATVVTMAGAARAGAPVPADTPSKTTSGAGFTLPQTWSLAPGANLVVANPPETDTHMALVDAGEAADAKSAIGKAWSLYRPDAHRVLKLIAPRAARNGWDERQVADYETSPNEKAAVQALALRSGKRWTVVIVDGSEATFEKRGAQALLIMQSLRPAGYARETFAGRTAHPLDPARIDAMKAFVQTAMEQLGVPGTAIAFIDHGKVVYEGGLGVKELGKPDPVDAHTLFMVASNTKGMSTLLLAELVDEGKIAWDQPVTQVYPAFRLGSDATTKKVLMRHLVCACTGLPRKDFDWLFNTSRTTPASTTFEQLAATEPTSGFGEVFQYNNLMASAAGYIGGHLVYPDREVGAAYDAAMQARIFGPLGMTETTFDNEKALATNHASPHGDYIGDGKPAVASMDLNYSIRPYRPAGGAWSSAHDMIKYVQDELTLGQLLDGRRLVSEKSLLTRRAHGMPIGEDAFYGMGLEDDLTWGVSVVHHGGSMGGFKTDILLVPDAQVGAVILTNADNGQMLLRPFMRRLLEVLYDGKPEAAGDVATSAARTKAQIAAERPRLIIPAAPEAAAGLAPHYVSSELGQITVSRDAQGVKFDFGLWSTHVASRKNDDGTLSFVALDPSQDGFEFVVATRDGKPALVLRDGQHEYVYRAG